MALQIAMAAVSAVQFMGLPEGRLPLTEAVIYLAAAPKSNSVIAAINAATEAVRNGEQHAVPLHLRNAQGSVAREMGHGKGYIYAHDTAAGVAAMPCLPDELLGTVFYRPSVRGFEQRISDRMQANDLHREDRGN